VTLAPGATPDPVVRVPEPAVVVADHVPAVAAAPVSNASVLATVDESVPIPTLAPAPVAARVVVSPSVVAPEVDPGPAVAPAPVPRPAPTPATPVAAPAASSYAPAPQSQGGGVALLERPVQAYADAATPAAPTSQFGGPAVPSVFGAAPAKSGFGTSQGGFGSFAGDGAAAAAYRPERHLGRTLVILGLVLVALAAAGVIGVPRYLDSKAAAAAAEQPNVLPRSAPAALAGLRKMPGQASANQALSASMTSQGSSWAWAATYGSRNNAVAYVGFDIPVTVRPHAYRALTNHGEAMTLVNSLATGVIAAGGTALFGQATEFASPVGGKVWCMPVTVNGSSGGICLWTNGKEGLVSMALPGVMDSAAKSTLVALGQLGKLGTRR
jgi:hypothetical protein